MASQGYGGVILTRFHTGTQMRTSQKAEGIRSVPTQELISYLLLR
jgi:hypothetical protein